MQSHRSKAKTKNKERKEDKMEAKTQTTENESLVTPCTEHPGSKKFWNAAMAILIFLIIVQASRSPSSSSKPTTSTTSRHESASKAQSQLANQELTIPINTTVWKKIGVTYGKSIKTLMILPQDGRVYSWWLVVNGDFRNPKKMPSGDDLGNNIQTLHCLLAKDEGVESGEIVYEEK